MEFTYDEDVEMNILLIGDNPRSFWIGSSTLYIQEQLPVFLGRVLPKQISLFYPFKKREIFHFIFERLHFTDSGGFEQITGGIIPFLFHLVTKRYDVMHCVVIRNYMLWLVVMAKLCRTKTIATMHDTMFLTHVKYNLTGLMKVFLFNTVDRILLLGKIDEERVKSLNIKIQYNVIKNGVSSIKSDVTIVRSNIIVFGGGLGNQHSGLQFLETAIKLLGKNVNLVICGTNARHQNHALYHGELDRDRFHSLVSYARIVVIPSEYESFSMVALESLSLGVPIIVSENCGISRYLTDEIDCLKVRYGDAESLGQKINRLMSNDELWSRLSYNGMLTAEKFLWENIIPEYVDIYKKISIKE